MGAVQAGEVVPKRFADPLRVVGDWPEQELNDRGDDARRQLVEGAYGFGLTER